MKFTLQIIILLNSIFCFSQLSDKVNRLYNELNLYNYMTGQHISYGGEESKLYLKYKQLSKIATDEELVYMVQNGNKAVKGYLSKVLVDRKHKSLSEVFHDFLKNDAEISITIGCEEYDSSISSELYGYLYYQEEKIDFIEQTKEGFDELKAYEKEIEGEDYIEKYRTKWNKKSVDSLLALFNTKITENDAILPISINRIFRILNYKFDDYKTVKYYAYKNPTVETLAALAHFQNREDLPLFHNHFNDALIAISKFPDESFLLKLEEQIEKSYYRSDYIEAITSFCNEKSVAVLSTILTLYESKRAEDNSFTIFDSEELDYLYTAVEKQNCPLYDNLLLKMWLDHKMISFTFFVKIKNNHYSDILKGFVTKKDFFSTSKNANADLSFYSDEQINGYLCPQILKYLKDNYVLNQDQSINLDDLQCAKYR